jgi:1,4-alpha-glucan branching enzyme
MGGGVKMKKKGENEAVPAKAKAARAPKAAPKTTRPKEAPEVTKGQTRQAGEGIKKQYLKDRSTCKVTFVLAKRAAADANKVTVVGDFNGWDRESTPMKRLKNGDFTVTMELEKGRDYHFRYLIDGQRWENDWNADRYEPNPHGSDDSVVAV